MKFFKGQIKEIVIEHISETFISVINTIIDVGYRGRFNICEIIIKKVTNTKWVLRYIVTCT